MFLLEQYPEILLHFQNISSIFRKETSGWYQIFCPYCDDAIRKSNPSHGHFHLAPNYPYGHCFRCGVQKGLDQILTDTNFTNLDIITKLRKRSGFTYGNVNKFKSQKHIEINTFRQKIFNHYEWFANTHPQFLKIFNEYIVRRCCEMNPLDFFILPHVHINEPAVQFYNYDGNLVTTRLILSTSIRYMYPNIKKYYYFQDIYSLDEYQDIVLTEGAFDLINLKLYGPFKNAFFLALGGNQYKGNIRSLINTYLLIGKYNIHVVLDQGLSHLDYIIKSSHQISNELNSEISLKFYLPSVSKDVSECMLLHRLS